MYIVTKNRLRVLHNNNELATVHYRTKYCQIKYNGYPLLSIEMTKGTRVTIFDQELNHYVELTEKMFSQRELEITEFDVKPIIKGGKGNEKES